MRCYICKKNEGKFNPIYGYPICRNCAKKMIFRKIGSNLRKNKIKKRGEIRIFTWESSLKDLTLEYLNNVFSNWRPKPKIILTEKDPDLKIIPSEVLFVYLLASLYDKKYFNDFLFLFEKNVTWNIAEKEVEFITGNYKIKFEDNFLNDIFNLFKAVADRNLNYYKTIVNSIRFAYENKVFFL